MHPQSTSDRRTVAYRLPRILRIAWIVLGVALLADATVAFDYDRYGTESFIFPTVVLAVLCFPTSVVVIGLSRILSTVLDPLWPLPNPMRGYWECVATMLAFIIGGYVQWFVAIPHLGRRLRVAARPRG